MRVSIPAKTFLIGEYAALQGFPAIVLTTTPAFEMRLTDQGGLQGIHEDAPAGRFWRSHSLSQGLYFEDPYQGAGGLGASSAQFVGAYRLYCQLTQQAESLETLRTLYGLFAWHHEGVKPSGYDVVAQAQPGAGCVWVNPQEAYPFAWPFDDVTFVLLHTRSKCVTHQHLKTLEHMPDVSRLGALVQQAMSACEQVKVESFIDAVQQYHETLMQLGWVQAQSAKAVADLMQISGVLAAKGCGAMGADIVCVLLERETLKASLVQFAQRGWWVVGQEASTSVLEIL